MSERNQDNFELFALLYQNTICKCYNLIQVNSMKTMIYYYHAIHIVCYNIEQFVTLIEAILILSPFFNKAG